MVEIAKALSQQARILIMDEPNLQPDTHRDRAPDGRSERLEIAWRQYHLYLSQARRGQELADRVIALRDGRNAGRLSAKQSPTITW